MTETQTVTAAVLVIGDEILSGRTKDRNIGYIAEYLARIAVEMREARVVPDDEAEIVAALNALRAAIRLRLHDRGNRADARRHHRRLRRQGVRRRDQRGSQGAGDDDAAASGGRLDAARRRMARIPRGPS